MIGKVHPNAKSVLDVGCGTGEHAIHLRKHFDFAGLDLDPQLVDIARVKNPDCEFHVADMVDFDLGRKFDVVLCLFSSIGYVKTIEKMKSTLWCFSKHLEPDGAIVVEPWFTYRQNLPSPRGK
jgi:trans-aconitate methyltransferase